MRADIYIPRLSNDMKIAVQKNNLGGQIWYRSMDPVKKQRIFSILRCSTNFINFIFCLEFSDLHEIFIFFGQP